MSLIKSSLSANLCMMLFVYERVRGGESRRLKVCYDWTADMCAKRDREKCYMQCLLFLPIYYLFVYVHNFICSP